jgi:hypothetical protein
MATAPEEYHYTGLHAFVFIEHVPERTTPREVVERLRAFGPPPDGPVLFAAEFVGDYAAFAHVRVDGEDDLAGLQDLIAGPLWDLGVHCKYGIEAAVHQSITPVPTKQGIKRLTPEVIALVAIEVERGRIDEVMKGLAALEGFKGASVLFGGRDLVAQLGGDSFLSVSSVVKEGLQSIPGIVHTSTAFTDARRYEDDD